jgi:hypothetical protein
VASEHIGDLNFAKSILLLQTARVEAQLEDEVAEDTFRAALIDSPVGQDEVRRSIYFSLGGYCRHRKLAVASFLFHQLCVDADPTGAGGTANPSLRQQFVVLNFLGDTAGLVAISRLLENRVALADDFITVLSVTEIVRFYGDAGAPLAPDLLHALNDEAYVQNLLGDLVDRVRAAIPGLIDKFEAGEITLEQTREAVPSPYLGEADEPSDGRQPLRDAIESAAAWLPGAEDKFRAALAQAGQTDGYSAAEVWQCVASYLLWLAKTGPALLAGRVSIDLFDRDHSDKARDSLAVMIQALQDLAAPPVAILACLAMHERRGNNGHLEVGTLVSMPPATNPVQRWRAKRLLKLLGSDAGCRAVLDKALPPRTPPQQQRRLTTSASADLDWRAWCRAWTAS